MGVVPGRRPVFQFTENKMSSSRCKKKHFQVAFRTRFKASPGGAKSFV